MPFAKKRSLFFHLIVRLDKQGGEGESGWNTKLNKLKHQVKRVGKPNLTDLLRQTAASRLT